MHELYFVVRVRCRRKESLRSLSHLVMSFLYNTVRISIGVAMICSVGCILVVVVVVNTQARTIKLTTPTLHTSPAQQKFP